MVRFIITLTRFLAVLRRLNKLAEDILDAFNSVNDKIQFTVDVPEHNAAISFLDIEIKIVNRGIEYKWHVKPCHSNNSLRKNSWIPNFMKTNYVRNSIKTVMDRCSNEKLCEEALSKLDNRFEQNGYHNVKLDQKIKKSEKNGNNPRDKCYLKLNFVSDSLNRKIKRILKDYDFPIQMVSIPAKHLKFSLNQNKKKDKHTDCKICDHLPQKYGCWERFLVYKFSCTYCNQFYIGETCRPFYSRYKEHQRSLDNDDSVSALSEHVLNAHRQQKCTLTDFNLDILIQCHSPVETRLAEARAINSQRPPLNRRYEKGSLSRP